MRTYLVVIDETEESGRALRFAARRATKTGGHVAILALIEQGEFVAWPDVQATMEDEARARAEALVATAAGAIDQETGLKPTITIAQGKPVDVVKTMLTGRDDIAALVLGAAATGSPGPLVDHFTGTGCGTLPCPVMVIPGSLSLNAIDRIS